MKLAFTMAGLPRRITILSVACLGTAIVVSACGGLRREQRAEWRAQVEMACIKSGKVRETPYVKISKSIDGPGVCGTNFPMKVSALTTSVPQNVQGTGNLMLTSGNMMLTSVTPPATLSCPMVAGVDAWLANEVQQAAMTWFGQPVIELITFGSFSCRPMNNQRGARLSEHSFANAIDAKGFRLADGRTVTVLKGWRGATDEQGFLREVSIGACRHFTTVLAPGSDAYHYDHLHMDMARHNRGMHVCRPKLQMPTPSAMQPPAVAGGYQGGPIYKSEPPLAQQRLTNAPILKPSAGSQQLYHGPDDGPDDIEDLRDERNFDGKQFDLTGSVTRPGDPKIVIQRPGPARR